MGIDPLLHGSAGQQETASMSEAANPNFPYIGCRISLISKHGIRYQGTLFSIHAEDHTICLNSVKCFGTEGRRAKDNLPEVPAATDVFEYIVFRGSDIQDLTVCEADQSAPSAPADPAILSTNQAPPGANPPAPQMPPVEAPPLPKPAADQSAKQWEPRPQRKAADGSLEGTGAYSMTRKSKAATGDQTWKAPVDEFDFAAQNQTFDKDQLAAEFEDQLKLEDEESNFYSKSSFFDNISCDATDRDKGDEGRNKKFSEQRKLDMETFGETFGRSHFRYRGGKGGQGQPGGKGSGKGGNSRGGRRNRNRNNRSQQPNSSN